MLRVGVVGIGFMGMIHYLAYQRVRKAKVVAISSRSAKKLGGDWRGIQGNFGPPGKKFDLTGLRGYLSLDKLLADPDVDLIDICIPPAHHAEAAVKCLNAGKHVLCEKPIALNGKDAVRMVQASVRNNRQLFVGQVLPFFPEYNFAYQAASTDKYGKPLGGHFKRVISDPLWIKNFYDPAAIGGPLIDLHIHDAHFIRLLWGMPTAVSSIGRMRGNVVESHSSQFYFEDKNVTVSAVAGVINQQGRSFTHGYEIHFERATLAFESAVVKGKPILPTPLTVFDDKGRASHPKLTGVDPIDSFAAELQEVTQCVHRSEPSRLLDGALASDALILCQKQAQSVARRSKVTV